MLSHAHNNKFVTSSHFEIVLWESRDGWEVRLLNGRTDSHIDRYGDLADTRSRAETLADGLFGDDWEINSAWKRDKLD